MSYPPPPPDGAPGDGPSGGSYPQDGFPFPPPSGAPSGHQQPAQPPGGYPYGYPPPMLGPEHPRATTILILGILSIVVCWPIGPFAWYMGNKALAEIDMSGGRISGRSNVNAGRICGIIGTVIMLVYAAFVVFMIILVGAIGSGSTR